MKSALWNELDVKQPPTFTCKLTSADISLSHLRKISDICWNALTTLKNQDVLVSESATLSRIIFRMKRMFRGDKGFKSLQKIYKCLRHFIALNLVAMYDNFFRTIPWECSDKEIYCPTLQMLEYVLLRTQGLAALLCRTVHTCHEAAHFLRSRISSGHNWQVSLLCLGAVSRIWALGKHILDSCIDWYSAMLPYTKIFKPNGPSWLPEDYIFPANLLSWLSVPWMHYEPPQMSSNSFLGLLEPVEDTGSTNVSSVNPTSQRPGSCHHSTFDDVGVSVSRSSIDVSSASLESPVSSVIMQKKVKKEEDVAHVYTGETNNFSRKKMKVQRKSNESRVMNSGGDKSVNLTEIHSINSKSDLPYGQNNSVLLDSKSKLLKNALSSLKSEGAVRNLIKTESKKRSLTSSLDDNQWKLLKGLLGKLTSKLQNAQNDKKKKQIINQIKKAFEIALS